MNSTMVSPAWMPAGRVMLWAVRLPALLEAATNDSTGSAALAAGTGLNPSAARVVASAVTSTRTSRW